MGGMRSSCSVGYTSNQITMMRATRSKGTELAHNKHVVSLIRSDRVLGDEVGISAALTCSAPHPRPMSEKRVYHESRCAKIASKCMFSVARKV